MRFHLSFGLLLSALALSSIGCAASADDSDEASSASEVVAAGPADGTFVLHAEANHTADPECDSFTDLELKAGGVAALADRLTGRCALVALHDPNPRGYTLRETGTSCGSKIYEGSRRVALGPATTGLATIKIIDHRTRLCKDLTEAEIIVEETAPGAPAKKLFSQRDAG
jgi:hypothetical protein